MEVIEWTAEGPELTISADQARAMAKLADEGAHAIRVRQEANAQGKTAHGLQVATFGPTHEWHGPFTIRKSGHTIPPGLSH